MIKMGGIKMITTILEYISKFLIGMISKYGIFGIGLDIIIVTMVIVGIHDIFEAIFGTKNQRNGNKYEDFVAERLKKFGVTPVRNVLLDNNDDETEIDMAFVNRKGIFAIECKYHSKGYSPVLKGGLNDKEWQVSEDKTMLNPFNQNHKHIKFIEDITGVRYIYNVVYSSTPFEFKYFGVVHSSADEPFINLFKESHALIYDKPGLFHKGTSCFCKAVSVLPDVLTDEEVENITKQLSGYQMDKKQRKEFAKRMEMKDFLREHPMN